MSGIVDDRLLERWETSRRHQDEARRFLARQRVSDAAGERRALEEIVATMTDLEQTHGVAPKRVTEFDRHTRRRGAATTRERAARRATTARPSPPRPAAS